MSRLPHAGHRILRRAAAFAGGLAAALIALTALAQRSPPGRWPLAVARWLLFAALAVALGGLAARALARRYTGPRPAPLPPPWALRASLLGMAAALVLAGRMWLRREPRPGAGP